MLSTRPRTVACRRIAYQIPKVGNGQSMGRLHPAVGERACRWLVGAVDAVTRQISHLLLQVLHLQMGVALRGGDPGVAQ